REHWLPRLASGETIGAFGLTEPDIGSHASGVETAVTETDNGFVINGHKKWISFAQKAGLFLVIGKWNKTPSAFLIERERPGVMVKPMGGLLGFRSAMLGEVILENCEIPASSIVGGVSVGSGFGFSHVATSALDLGRLSVAWGCLGLAESCLQESLSYSGKRQQGKFKLSKYQLIQEMLAEMVTNIQATRALCYHASWLRDKGDPNAIMEICIAKYFASRMVGKCASDTLQIHGANGCGPDYPVQRYWRDARIMEIIEGSTQIQQLLISRYGFQNSDA
ncbi:MAG: acyl-CoA dehydrogenase family protein, partial [Enterobacter roggenkampii]